MILPFGKGIGGATASIDKASRAPTDLLTHLETGRGSEVSRVSAGVEADWEMSVVERSPQC